MKKTKDLNACISLLESVQSGNSVDPEQRQAVGHVIDEVRRIRRKPNLRRHELHESVRRIAETLIRAFVDRD